jgi:type I restriction-modification enzyme S subunit
VRLEDIFEFIRNGAQIKQFDGAGIPITRIETISNLKIDTNRLGYADIFNDDYQEYYLQNGDLLMSHINSPAHLGKTAIVEQLNKKIIHGMNLLCLRANHQVIPKYIFYYFQTQPFKNALTKIMKKSVNQASISVSDLKKIEITISSYSEQSNSVAILEQLDYQISLRQQQLQTLAQLVKSRFYEMFGDPVLNEMDWEVCTLKEICIKLTDGTHSSPKSFSTGKYRYVTAKNIKPSGFDFSNITFVSEEVHRSIYARCNPEQGDVLYIKDGATTGIAMVNTLDEEFTLLSSVALLKQNRKLINGCFLTSVLNHDMMFSNIRRNMGGAAITRLTISKLNNIQIPLPPLALQNQFADFVAEVDKSQLACQKSLDELETLKKSLMQAYFG